MNSTSTFGLRVGDIVEVRSATEILSSLDSHGTVDALPFMPEMLKYCGQRFRVFKRADKTCDTIEGSGLRRMTDAVHLEHLRCDGAAHGGCQAGCLLFWKERWLKKVTGNGDPPLTGVNGIVHDIASLPVNGATAMTEATLHRLALGGAEDAGAGEPTFVCQATMLREATVPLPWWEWQQYVRDLRSGNVSIATFVIDGVRQLAIWFINTVQSIRRKGGYPFWQGQLARTPTGILDLEPGEKVQVKTLDEIVQTLDTRNNNRGLSFNNEMVKYCGKQFKVLRRVDKIINEKTGKMMHFPNKCIILDGVTCDSHYHKFCPRSIYAYWREIWLKRVDSQ